MLIFLRVHNLMSNSSVPPCAAQVWMFVIMYQNVEKKNFSSPQTVGPKKGEISTDPPVPFSTLCLWAGPTMASATVSPPCVRSSCLRMSEIFQIFSAGNTPCRRSSQLL